MMLNNLDRIGKEIVDSIKEKIDREGISTTGSLSKSFHYIINGSKIEIYANEYAKFVDSGSKPHYLNKKGVQSIIEWAKIKMPGINPWGVITNIRLYGTKPHPYLDAMYPTIDKIVKNGINDFIGFTTDKIYQQLRDTFNTK